ncbi:MAG: rod shape-determining protein [Lachnospiraceae bacterium]|nr:rod shape-determining protein [Lachnospiraceae bacterium]
MRQRCAGFDFGSYETKICGRNQEIFHEKTMLVLDMAKGRLVCFGNEAYEYYEKAPEGYRVVMPVQEGKIYDLASLKILAALFVQKYRIGRNDDVYLAVPGQISQIEQRAYEEVFLETKVKRQHVHLLKRPLAVAAGAGMKLESPAAKAIVDVGSHTTEIAVVASEGIIASKTFGIGSQWLDGMIALQVKKKYQIQIGRRSGQRLKLEPEEIQVIKGLDLTTGLPIEIKANVLWIGELFEEFFEMTEDSIKELIEKLPGAAAADLIKQGICLAGGGAKSKGMASYLEKELGIPVWNAKYKEDAAILGMRQWITKDRKIE